MRAQRDLVKIVRGIEPALAYTKVSRGTVFGMSQRVRAELAALCVAYPDPSTAARWKKHLREIRAELVAETDPEAG